MHFIDRPSALASALLATTMLAGMPALAEDVAQAGLETVTVSAQKLGEQDLQKVPVSIAVLDNQKLEDLRVNDFRDFVRFLPSVSFTAGGQGSSGGPGQGNISMRGVTNGADGNHSGPLPTVGMYLDEIPITTIGGNLDVPTYDLARVEALAGPQGTLFGASSEAGTIRLITNQPDATKFAAGYEVEGNKVDAGGFGYGLRGFLNVPIDDHMAIRLVAWSQRDAGYIDNVHATRTYTTAGITIDNAALAKKDYNDTSKLGARLALGIDLDDNWTVTASVIGQLEKSNGIGGFDPAVGDLKVHHFYPEFAKDHWYQAALTVTGKIGNLDLTYATGYMDRRGNGASDYTDYAFWYDQLGLTFNDNNGNVVDPSQRILFADQFTKWSNELRLASPSTDRLRFVVGLFHESQTHNILQNYVIDALGTDFSVPGWPHTIWLTEQQRKDRDLAAFTQVSYDILPDLTLTAGVRVFDATNKLEGFFGLAETVSSHTGVANCAHPLVPSRFGGPCTNVNKHVYEWGETHKFNLQWQIDDADMVYATYSTGFRPGGINRVASLPNYNSDSLDNFEIGWKTSWFQNTLRWNGAAYWENWNKFQFAFLGLNSLTQIANAGAARIQGVESDVTWQPVEGFTLTGSGAYNYARLTKVYCGDLDPVTGALDVTCPNDTYPYPPAAPKGSLLPSTPRFKGNLTGRYEFAFYDIKAHLQGSLVYQTKAYPDLRVQAPSPWDGSLTPIRQMLGLMPAFATFDLTTGIEKDNWSVELAAQNLFDERGQNYRYAYCTTQVCGYEPYILPTKPRFFSITVSQKF
jgi:Outer membrane receptor proteins, mostly Fe transport